MIVWTLAATIAFFTTNFEELGIVTPVMMVVVCFIFGLKTPGINDDESQ